MENWDNYNADKYRSLAGSNINETFEHNPRWFHRVEVYPTPTNPNKKRIYDQHVDSVMKDHISMYDQVKQQHNHLANSVPTTLSDDELKIVRQYTQLTGHGVRSSSYINKQLAYPTSRTSTEFSPFSLFSRADKLSKIIETHAPPLDQELHVYSGLSGYNPSDHFKNGIIHTPTFTSTSLNPNKAADFVSEKNHRYYGDTYKLDQHFLHFHLPVGYKNGMYVDTLSDNSGELEYLLNKDQKWKLVKHQIINNTLFNNTRKDRLGKTSKSIVHNHIWSVVPHDESITEGYNPLTDEERKVEFGSKRLENNYPYMDDHSFQDRFKLDSEIEPQHIRDQHTQLLNLHQPHFTAEHKNAIVSYTGGGVPPYIYAYSGNLNRELIASKGNIKPPEYKQDYGEYDSCKVFDDMFKNLPPLDHNVHTYSALGFDPSKHFKKGIFKTPAFISSSINPYIAHGVTIQQKNHIIHYDLPKGYKHAAYIAGSAASCYTIQREMLINRDQKFKLHAHHIVEEPENAHKIHIWHVVPHDDSVTEGYNPLTDEQRNVHFSQGIRNIIPSYMSDSEYKSLIKHPLKNFVEHPEILEQHAQLSRLHQPHFTQEHKHAIVGYTGSVRTTSYAPGYSYSGTINNSLVNNEKLLAPNVKRSTKTLDSIFHTIPPLDHNVHTYSGLGFDPSKHFDHNNVFKTPAFISSSLNPSVALGVGKMHKYNFGYTTPAIHILHFDLPEGYKHAAYIAPEAGDEYTIQREMLINRGQKFKLHEHHIISDEDGIQTHIWHVKPL